MNGNTLSVLTEVADERAAQDLKFGQQDLPDGTGSAFHRYYDYKYILPEARAQNDGHMLTAATFESVLCEEFCEAMLETNPMLLRAELIQVAAVAVKWVEAIDRRVKDD